MMAGGDDLATLHKQVALASSAAISASDLDLAFQLQVAEAIQASLRSPNAAAPFKVVVIVTDGASSGNKVIFHIHGKIVFFMYSGKLFSLRIPAATTGRDRPCSREAA
jgi:hypothetical protein